MEGNAIKIENLNLNERIGRFVVSFVVVVFSTLAPWVGSDMFAVTNIIAILLSLTAITGWDPVRAVAMDKAMSVGMYLPHKLDEHHWLRK